MSTSTDTKTATPKAATSKPATSKPATSKPATSKADRMAEDKFIAILGAIRDTGQAAESFIQEAFLASWKDLACSHSCDRLSSLWDVLSETNSPFKTQISLAMRAMAGMASPVKSGQKWHRTGREPLSYTGDGWVLNLEDEDKRVLAERAEWRYHFRAIQVKAAVSAFTWEEAASFAERIRKARKKGRIAENDLKLFIELLNEIERISAR